MRWILAILLCSSVAQAGTTVISGSAAMDDAQLCDGIYADSNFGAGTPHHWAFNDGSIICHGVFKIHTVQIPEGTILGATLNSEARMDTGATGTIAWYRSRRDWNEGDGNPTDAGEVTWNSAKHSQVSWTTGGGDNTSTDRQATADFTFPLESASGGYIEVNVDMAGAVTSLTNWRDGVWSNYGWVARETSHTVNAEFALGTSDGPLLNVTITYSRFGTLPASIHPE